MSNDELANLIYGYARAACRTTPLDYRDVAHNVIVRHWTRYIDGRIRHVRTYMYIAIGCTIASMMKAKALVFNARAIDLVHCYMKDRDIDVDLICSKLTKKECFVLDRLRKGYNRKEIAEQLGITRNGVNSIWYRMIHRLRGTV